MDWVLLVVAIGLLIVGLIGCVLPVIPGPPISFAGIMLAHFTRFADFSTNKLLAFAFAAIAVTLLDYVVPMWGTKKFGGTNYGQWGATLGLIIGLFFGPPGIIIGPFAGAVIAESVNGANSTNAFRSGLGAFIGFLAGVGLKLITSIVMTYYFVRELIV